MTQVVRRQVKQQQKYKTRVRHCYYYWSGQVRQDAAAAVAVDDNDFAEVFVISEV